MRPFKAMFLDDHYIVRHGLIGVAEKIRGLSVIGSYGRSREMLSALEACLPDIILLDFTLHPDDIDGCTLIRLIKTKFPSVKIIVLSGHARSSMVRLAMMAGANGFCSKGSSLDELEYAIRRVLSGRQYVPNFAKPNNVLAMEFVGAKDWLSRSRELTKREREVIQLFIMGMSISEISEKLSRDRKTISGHKQSAYRKLGISSDAEMFSIRHMLDY